MTFWWLAAGVCVSVYFLALIGAQGLMLLSRGLVTERLFATSKGRANCLFAIGIFPVAIALMASLGLALPAFLKFEPRITHEGFSTRLWILSSLGLALLLLMIFRGLRMLRNTWLVEQHWRQNSQDISPKLSFAGIPVHQVDDASSLMAVTGFVHPRIFVSRRVVELLSSAELAAALAHEAAHAGGFDNFKLWLLKIIPWPSWLTPRGSDTAAWTNESEIAADDAALAHGIAPLNLVSAVVKVARLKAAAMAPPLAVCHLVPDRQASSLGARLAHLKSSLEMSSELPAKNRGHLSMALLVLLPIALYGVCLSVLLPIIHEALEFLVS